MKDKLLVVRDFFLKKKLLTGSLLVLLLVIVSSGGKSYFLPNLFFLQSVRGVTSPVVPEVSLPTIVNGELILPSGKAAINGLAQLGENSRVEVQNAILIPYFEQDRLVRLRVLGEMENKGQEIIDGISPVVRFFDKDGKVVGQKLATLNSDYHFFSLEPGSKTIYDFTIADPPVLEKVEIMVNVSSATSSALFEPLKIASRSIEIKKAISQATSDLNATDSGQSPGKEVEYYRVFGRVVNTQSDPYSDITIYAWAKGEDNRVISFEKQEFKNDLLLPGGSLDFKITLLPLRLESKLLQYEIAAWGKRYTLDLPN